MHYLLPVALAAAAMAAPTKVQSRIQMPVQERSLTLADGSVDAHALLTSLNNTLIKYRRAPLPSYPGLDLQKRGNNLALTDQTTQGEDQLYYGPITVGSAKQSFTIDFDTGSADLFIPGPKCGSAQGCAGTTKYNQKGVDQNRTTSVTYGSGQIAGEDYKDAVSVAGLTVPSQGFISLSNAKGFSSSKSDGLMGMGFSTIAQTKFPTFMENLIAAGKVASQEFSFFLGRAKSNTQGQSELTIGGRDAARFTGTPHSVPVTTKGYWQVAVDDVVVGSKSAGADAKGQAAIDTGTTIVLAPTKAAAAIFAQIPGSSQIPITENGIHLYSFPCSTTATPAITFNGQNFAINPLDFSLGNLGLAQNNILRILGVDSPLAHDDAAAASTCIAGLAAADLKTPVPLYVVGDVFLKNWYSIFSYNGTASVSFAPAVGNQ